VLLSFAGLIDALYPDRQAIEHQVGVPTLHFTTHTAFCISQYSAINHTLQENMVFENPDTLAGARARLDKFTEDVQMQVSPIKIVLFYCFNQSANSMSLIAFSQAKVLVATGKTAITPGPPKVK
jgi:hypothetical protein